MTTVPYPKRSRSRGSRLSFSSGEEVELVVDLQIADRAEDITDILLLIEERHGVAWCEGLQVAVVEPSPVATEGLVGSVGITDGTRAKKGVDCTAAPIASLLAKRLCVALSFTLASIER